MLLRAQTACMAMPLPRMDWGTASKSKGESREPEPGKCRPCRCSPSAAKALPMRVNMLRTMKFDRGTVAGAALFTLALLLGGGSLRFPLTRMIVELAASAVLVGYAVRGWRAPVDRWSAAAMLLLLLAMLLPLIQVIPLPPLIWSALPGRDAAAAAISYAGLAPRWMPISLQPDATRLAAPYLLVPITLFVVTLHATAAQRVRYGWVIAACALFSAMLGLLQAGGSENFYLYNVGRYTASTGFFANKNHYADLLLIGMLLIAGLTRVRRRYQVRSPSPLVAAALIALLVVALPAANSRMALALLPLALLPAAVLLIPTSQHRRFTLRNAAIVLAVLAALVAVAASSGVVTRLIDRFGGEPDMRFTFWPDVLTAIRTYQPVGSGLGSFIKIFQRHESMTTLHFTYVFHAHNDFLEVALEAGWAGAVLLALGVVLLLIGAGRVLRRTAWERFTPMHVAAVFGIAILLAHSLVDYPLRTLTMASVLAFLAGCLAPAMPGEQVERGAGRGD
jgi:O-antigen ligase